jgi:peptide deformylase
MAEIRKIITEEDPLLHEKSVEVKRFDGSLHKLLDDMKLTMYQADGVGLAAPQVGILKQIAVVDDREHGFIELINPRIMARFGHVESIEFCLSVPDRGGKVMRASDINVCAQDRFGKPFTINAKGKQAIVFQHEIDHLHGILFTDIMIAEISKDEFIQADNED